MVVKFSTITPTAMKNMNSHGHGMYLSVLTKPVNKHDKQKNSMKNNSVLHSFATYFGNGDHHQAKHMKQCIGEGEIIN
jgi:intergrase/recombinase